MAGHFFTLDIQRQTMKKPPRGQVKLFNSRSSMRFCDMSKPPKTKMLILLSNRMGPNVKTNVIENSSGTYAVLFVFTAIRKALGETVKIVYDANAYNGDAGNERWII